MYQIDTDESTLDYGVPNNGYIKISGFNVPANGTLEFKCQWVSSSNMEFYGKWLIVTPIEHVTYLPKGNFYTSFSNSFKIGGPLDPTPPDFEGETFITDILDFEVRFTVK